MTENPAVPETTAEVPADVLASPVLLFLYYRIDHILGIKTKSEALKKLNGYIEENCGCAFIENPAPYESLLTSREHIFNISKFLTVNETYFFREGVHYKLLERLLPELIKLDRPVQICSAAVSTGCEAYSIAMLLDYHIKNGLKFDFAIDAFDVNSEAVETAKSGRYTSNAFRKDGSDWKYIYDSYLIKDNGDFLVSQNIIKKVRFFPHNIMHGLDKKYDIIFFKNALIYFSSKNRLTVINNLAEALLSGGYLFLGLSETSSVKHPLLDSVCSCDTFYFQKKAAEYLPRPAYPVPEPVDLNSEKTGDHSKKSNKKPQEAVKQELPVDYSEISDILKTEEGKPNAQEITALLDENKTDSVSGGRFAAAVIYNLHSQDFESADKILSFLEKNNTGACIKFLRGEYYFLQDNNEKAQHYFHEASVKDKYFWPAFYRLTVLYAQGNQTRYKYIIKKTIESIEFLQNAGQKAELNYECFMGGFSTDYFLRILEKKLT
jgi:chemotaxis protein methyltransferase CheR